MEPSVAREVWLALEPIHAAIYFAPEARDAFADAGLKGFWMGYFASRAAPLGPASTELVTATFFGFHRPALPWPESPTLRLWHASTLLREHRGDGHVIALGAACLDGCAAHVVAAASGVVDRATLQPNRGFNDSEWSDAADRVADRGAELRTDVEARTDALALQPYEAIGDAAVTALLRAAAPLASRILSAGAIPMPNPMGLPSPAG